MEMMHLVRNGIDMYRDARACHFLGHLLNPLVSVLVDIFFLCERVWYGEEQ